MNYFTLEYLGETYLIQWKGHALFIYRSIPAGTNFMDAIGHYDNCILPSNAFIQLWECKYPDIIADEEDARKKTTKVLDKEELELLNNTNE